MDDGLLLNLAPDDGASAPNTRAVSSKSGRWTDRLKAKRVNKRKEQPTPASNETTANDDLTRPAKRPRKDGHAPSVKQHTSTKPNQQIVSSLFTSNPVIAKPAPIGQHFRRSGNASNAPLTDSSTFGGLGLHPLLIAHLKSKMNIAKPTAVQRAALPSLLEASDNDAGPTRDVFIQSQTGSGKTLAFLLPIIQDLLPLSSLSYIDRSIGTLAVIIAPTRELAKQISDVLEALLKLRLRETEAIPDAENEDDAPRRTRWLVSGLLTGGATRQHEKARLRKGIPILVSTPGRLLDHLQNTESFNVGKCRWLVLDEADRLLELGFEETLQGILKGMEGRRNLAQLAATAGQGLDVVGGWEWKERRTVLCSATMREDVQKLAGTALKNPIVIKGGDAVEKEQSLTNTASAEKFTPPSQLSQKYVVVPLKLRLVALVALLRFLIAQSSSQHGTKIIVFLSCTDSVDFHWRLLGGTSMTGGAGKVEGGDDADDSAEDGSEPLSDSIELRSPLLPSTALFRLHGALPLATRTTSLDAFASAKSTTSQCTSSVLLCTSVASRGLDLPLVRAVVQYDLPTEGGSTEYVHRVGRTARAGKGGEAWAFVGPSEADWVPWVERQMNGEGSKPSTTDAEDLATSSSNKKVKLDAVGIEHVLKKGYGGKGVDHETRATEVQLAFERWVLRDQSHATLSRKAYLSHMRAYATHPSDEKHLFHVRNLHIGHLAKAFALREAPTTVGAKGGQKGQRKGNPNKLPGFSKKAAQQTNGKQRPDSEALIARKKARGYDQEEHELDPHQTENRMREVVRAQGRLSKKGGVMMNSGLDEFQIASGYSLEKMVNGK